MAASLGEVLHRRFASTGSSVSVLGLGTVKFGRNQGVKYPGGEGFALPTDQEVSSILDLCLERGINLIDGPRLWHVRSASASCSDVP